MRPWHRSVKLWLVYKVLLSWTGAAFATDSGSCTVLRCCQLAVPLHRQHNLSDSIWHVLLSTLSEQDEQECMQQAPTWGGGHSLLTLITRHVLTQASNGRHSNHLRSVDKHMAYKNLCTDGLPGRLECSKRIGHAHRWGPIPLAFLDSTVSARSQEAKILSEWVYKWGLAASQSAFCLGNLLFSSAPLKPTAKHQAMFTRLPFWWCWRSQCASWATPQFCGQWPMLAASDGITADAAGFPFQKLPFHTYTCSQSKCRCRYREHLFKSRPWGPTEFLGFHIWDGIRIWAGFHPAIPSLVYQSHAKWAQFWTSCSLSADARCQAG